MMNANISNCSDSVCSDDTEYLLGQNASFRDIDDGDDQSDGDNNVKFGKAQKKELVSRRHSPLQTKYNLKVSPPRRSWRGKDQRFPSPQRLNGNTDSFPIKTTDTRVDDQTRWRTEDVHQDNRGITQSMTKHQQSQGAERVLESVGQFGNKGSEHRSHYSGYVEAHDFHYEEEINIGTRIGEMPKMSYLPTRDSGLEYEHKENVTPFSPPTKYYHDSSRKSQETNAVVSERDSASAKTLQPWVADATASLDITANQRAAQAEQNDLTSIMSDATEDLVGISGEEDLDEEVTEKLRKLNLAVNFDAEINDYCDDKVKEGAELLSKLFGGSVDNYYSSSSGHSKSSASGNAQDGSRTGSHLEETKDLSDSGIRDGLKPALLAESRQTKKNKRTHVSFATDESSSFDSTSAVSYAQRRHQHLGSQRDTQFSKRTETSQNHKEVKTHGGAEGEFIRETLAFRAAMNYEDDESEELSTSHHHRDQEDKCLELKQSHQVVDRSRYQSDEVSASSTKQSASSSLNRPAPSQVEQGHEGAADWKPRPGQYYEKRSTASPRRSAEPRFKAEKYPDNTRKELSSILTEDSNRDGGFMTSTPQIYKQSELSDATADVQKDMFLQLKMKETESRLHKSIQELRDVEFDKEEAMTNKKIMLQEVHSLEEQLKRNRAEVQSSENLVEQYTQQATKARGQLMELEVQRENLQQDIKKTMDLLARQKQQAAEVTKSDRENEMRVFELSLENDQLHRDLDSLKTRLQQTEGNLEQEKNSYLEKVGLLQDQLHDEQRISKETIEKLKEQVEDERQKARDCHYERISIIHKLQDETKDMHDKELESLKTRLAREKDADLDALQKKMDREMESVQRKIQDRDLRSKQIEIDLKEKEVEVRRLKSEQLQEQQKMHDNETSWREDLDKSESHNESLKREMESIKHKDVSAQKQLKKLEEMVDEKTCELRRSEEKSSAQYDELYQVIQNKENEVQLLRGLVRQQEDSTRLLGETMRNEAQEHIRSALENEREGMDKERSKHQDRLTEVREQYEKALTQLREDLEAEKQGHHHLQSALHKIKKEVERLRQLNLQAEEQKVTAVNQVRSDAKEELALLKDKLQLVTSLTEKSERETVQELHDEVRRNAALLGDSGCSTPVRNLSSSFHGDSPSSTAASPTHSALMNLRSCNEELRQHLVEARRELEQQKDAVTKKQNFVGGELSTQQLNLVKKAMKSKEDEVARVKRELHEDSERNTLQMKSERSAYQKTIERLERELRQTKALTPTGSPTVNGFTSPLDNTSLINSSMGTSPSSAPSPRTGNDSNTARLLRHLQGRVQLLRSQNESLRKSSDTDLLNESQSSIGTASVDSFEVTDEASQIRRLQDALKLSEAKSQKNTAMLNQKVNEMTKLQKMLTYATKENMNLERAYASLQRKMIDGTR